MIRRSIRLVLFSAAALTAALPTHADKPRKVPAPLPAGQYPMHDEHSQVVIAAEPDDTRATVPDTRLDYLGNDMLPIRVIVTNNSDLPITLDDARIDLITGDNAKILAATPDDLNRRLFELKQARGSKVPLPAPLPPITIHHKPVDEKILADDKDFGFKTTTIAPHATVAGYLYYDVRGIPLPVLKNATLELRKVRWQNPGSVVEGDSLDSFEIDLQPSAAAEKAADTAQARESAH